MVLPLIPFRPFLQALVVRSVALKREFISIPRWQQLSDDGISSSPICQLYIRFFSRGFSEDCNMYDLFCIKAETPFSWIFTANIGHTLQCFRWRTNTWHIISKWSGTCIKYLCKSIDWLIDWLVFSANFIKISAKLIFQTTI